MNELKADFEVEALAQALEVSPSGFYAYQQKARRPRAQADQMLSAKIKTIFADSRRTYGSPRVCAALRRDGHRCGKTASPA